MNTTTNTVGMNSQKVDNEYQTRLDLLEAKLIRKGYKVERKVDHLAVQHGSKIAKCAFDTERIQDAVIIENRSQGHMDKDRSKVLIGHMINIEKKLGKPKEKSISEQRKENLEKIHAQKEEAQELEFEK